MTRKARDYKIRYTIRVEYRLTDLDNWVTVYWRVYGYDRYRNVLSY